SLWSNALGLLADVGDQLVDKRKESRCAPSPSRHRTNLFILCLLPRHRAPAVLPLVGDGRLCFGRPVWPCGAPTGSMRSGAFPAKGGGCSGDRSLLRGSISPTQGATKAAAQLSTAAPFFLFSLRYPLRADAFCFLRTTLSGLTHFAFCREECLLSLVC